jgi:hypothetical protein
LPSVRDTAAELGISMADVVRVFLSRGEMKTASSELSPDEIDWLKTLIAEGRIASPGRGADG